MMSDFEKSINASDLIDWIMCAFPDWCVGDVRAIVDHVNEMPPAQAEVAKDTNVPNNDCISRQAAIELILADKIDNKSLEVMEALGSGNEAKTLNMTCDRHAGLLKKLPSAQPEPILEQIEEYCHKRCLSIVDTALLHKYAQAETQPEPELTELLVCCPKCGHTMSVIDKDTLIRCQDCYHSVEEDNGKRWCNHPQNICLFVKPTDFCSKSERRTDETD